MLIELGYLNKYHGCMQHKFRDLRSFEIPFESDFRIRLEGDRPIRKFRIAEYATFAIVP